MYIMASELGTWARTDADKAQVFANHLASVFQPHPPETDSLPEDTFTSFLETPFQLSNVSNDPRYKHASYQSVWLYVARQRLGKPYRGNENSLKQRMYLKHFFETQFICNL
jgi:hypothetical protein